MDNYLAVENLHKEFDIKEHMFKTLKLKAVGGISFAIKKGQALALVGESGCGKSTVARCILRLIEPTEGSISFNGREITELDKGELREIRGKIQMVFQDPYDSLNPRMTVRQMLRNAIKLHRKLEKDEIDSIILESIGSVGLDKDHINRYPHEFSGGQQQRIGIARALATGAEFLILDEPTSALDTSIRGQILTLLIDLQDRLNLSYLFITHDLSVIRYICDHTAVMYLGKIFELGPTETLMSKPINPYTQALMSAIPIPDPSFTRERIKIEKEPPSPIHLPQGCRFSSRCIYVHDKCLQAHPPLEEYADGHYSSCYVSDRFV